LTNSLQGITYQIFVQSFSDSNGDGIGDINDIIGRLDYLSDLSVDAIWLTPIHPSPSYHKYDVVDYYAIDPTFGSMDDFQNLINQAHLRGIKIIIDLVINHCSEQHPWFQAAKNPASEFRDYFIWKTKEEIKAEGIETKEITGDSDNRNLWNELPDQDQLYYSFFWKGMPDLNFDNDNVRKEVFEIGRFWLQEIGVDGFRLDAAKHIYPDDRIDDTVAFWKEFKAEMIRINPNVALIGEVWSNIEVQAAFTEGFTCLFNFDLSYSILESVKRGHIVKANTFENTWKVEERGSPVDIYLESAQAFETIDPSFDNGTFLSNHDQNRVVSFLGNNLKEAKLAASILLTLPGKPFI
jgi:alpha-amylase